MVACGNGVVHVQDVELLPQRHLVLLRRQRQRVGVVIEQRIPPHSGLDLVEVDPLGVAPQPEGGVVGDEVHLVAPPRQLEPQLGGHGAGAAVGGIAGDAELHGLGGKEGHGTGKDTREGPQKPAAPRGL